jgi:hypothetical protein
MTNSGHSPVIGNFCMGVWKQTGARRYKLNHFAIGWDSTGMTLIGPAHIQEDVTVDSDGDHFTGSFSIDQYTEAGNLVTGGHVQGVVTRTRITVNTPPQSIF